MKNLFFIAFLLLLSSCGNNARKEELAKKAQADSLKAERLEREKREWQKKEERKIWLDSMAVFAWGDAKFGMTKQEVLQTNAFKGSSKYDDSFSMDFKKESALKESLGLKENPSIWIEFEGLKKEVSRVRISESVSYSYLENLLYDLPIWFKEFEKKYGEPTAIYRDPFKIRSYEIKHTLDICYWRIGRSDGKYGSKEVYFSIYKNSYDGIYSLDINIYNKKYPISRKPKTDKEIEEEEKYNQMVRDAKDNAF